MTEIAPLLGVLAGAIGVADMIPYVRDTMRGTTRPHRGTWLIWGALAIVVYCDPESETLVTFAFASLAGALAAGAVGSADVSLLLYPAYYCLINGAIALLIHHRRAVLGGVIPRPACALGASPPATRVGAPLRDRSRSPHGSGPEASNLVEGVVERLGALNGLPERALQVERIVVHINGKQAASVRVGQPGSQECHSPSGSCSSMSTRTSPCRGIRSTRGLLVTACSAHFRFLDRTCGG